MTAPVAYDNGVHIGYGRVSMRAQVDHQVPAHNGSAANELACPPLRATGVAMPNVSYPPAGPTSGGRRPWQPHLDLGPPTDAGIAALVDAVHEVGLAHGFQRDSGWNVRAVDSDADAWTDDGRFLHIQAAWTRHPEDPGSVVLDGLSVWGTGLVRGGTAAGTFEVLVR
jgi:hypothetical protein